MAELEMTSPTPYLESPMDGEGEDVIFPCKGCGEILEEGKAFELAGNRWHIDCFCCHNCGTLLDSDANLLLLGDGSLICNECTYSCNACGNKIEDLAILTGDQAFCSACFRCRNCKKKIEDLRYARTTVGIFCMTCHEAVMARRRKKKRTNPKTSSSVVKEKALPSLPPGAAPSMTFSPDSETPPSEATPTATPPVRSPPEKFIPRREVGSNNTKRDVSPLSGDAHRDGPTLPASTYHATKASDISRESEDDEERGFLPMAFDPNPVTAPAPLTRKEIPRPQEASPPAQNDVRSRDYFGRSGGKMTSLDVAREEQRPGSTRDLSAEREPQREARASPHIMFQAKGNRKKSSGSTNTPSVGAAAAPSTAPIPQEKSSDRTRTQQLDAMSRSHSQNEGFKLQEVPKSKRASSKTSSKNDEKSPSSSLSPIDTASKEERSDKLASQSPASEVSANSSVNPFEDPKRKQGNSVGATPVVPARQADRPVRGDSLAPGNRNAKTTPEMQQTSTIPSSMDRKPSASSIPSVVTDSQSNISRDNSLSATVGSPPARTSFDAPPPRASSRPMANSSKVASEEFTAPRAPPAAPPTTGDKHRKEESTSTMQSNEFATPTSPTSSTGLPKHSVDAPFSMEEEMARIMHGDAKRGDATPSMLRKVSKAVKHGRSFSDRGIQSPGKSSLHEVGSPITISSPILSSPTGKDTSDMLASQLKRAQQRIAELESDVNRLEEKVNSSAEIKNANNELREKRTTMVVLDTQREMVVRELEVMTEHLSRAKDNNKPLDLNTLKTDVLKDFAESLQKLKDQMSPQIEDLMHRRSELTEEIGALIQMKDKGFQEYESLSNKNAQLVEMNNQILANIQEMYKTNRVPNGSAAVANAANGLGIYHPGAKIDSGPSDIRNLNMVTTDSSMPNLLQENEAEPATVLTAPQVVNIRKGQPKKFNWRKGGEKMAKNVTKGIKGAFEKKDGESPYNIGMPYNQTHQAVGGSELNGLSGNKAGLDPNNKGPAGFGFFGQKGAGTKAHGLGSMRNNSSANLAATDASVLFGSELEARCEYEKRVIPSIVTRCIEEVESRGMDTEGIYRKSGGSGQVKHVQQGFEKEGSSGFDISDPDLDIHAITSTLKQYFRKLPTPLITYDAYESLLDAGRLQDREKQALALRVAIAELPDHHRDCLEYLIQHLARVMVHESANLMTPLNLAVVFAPTIMRPLSLEREMSDMQAQRTAVQALLDQFKTVFLEE